MNFKPSFLFFIFSILSLLVLNPISIAQEEDNNNMDYIPEGTEAINEFINWLSSSEGIFFIVFITFSIIAGSYGGMLVGGFTSAILLVVGMGFGVVPAYFVIIILFMAGAIISYTILKLITGRGGGEE